MHPVHGGGGGEPCVPERPCGLLKAHSWWEAEQDPNPRHPAASPARTMTVFSQHMSWVRGVTHLVLREGLGHAGSWKTSWDGATRLHSGPRPRPASIPATLYQALPTWTRLGAAARSQSSWAESCLHPVPAGPALPVFASASSFVNWVVVVTTSQDGYGGKFSENLQDVEQYLTYKKTLSKC